MAKPIVIVQESLKHYRIPLFNRLSQKLANNLIVLAGNRDELSSTLLQSCEFEVDKIESPPLANGTLTYQDFIPTARHYRPAAMVVPQSVRNVGLYYALLRKKALRCPLIIWGHGSGRYRPITDNHPLNKLHAFQLNRADACILYTERKAKEARQRVSQTAIFTAHNTLDTNLLGTIYDDLKQKSEQNLRTRLGLNQDKIFVFIGRLHKQKAPALLLDLVYSLRGRGQNVSAIFIGEGPERTSLENDARRRQIPALFLGAINEWTHSAPYIFLASALVMPQWVGLAANHGIALGTPILCYEPAPGSPIHPPEIDYVVDGVTGFIVPFGEQDSFADRAEDLIAKGETFQSQCIAYTKANLKVENWVGGFLSAFREVGI